MAKTFTFRELREAEFDSQAEFARAMGISKGTACGWETGKRTPNIKQIIKIAKLLKVSRYVVLDIVISNQNDSD